MKNIQLTTEQALELYKTNPEYRNTLLSVFTDEELNIKPVLRDWEDLDFSEKYYPDYFDRIHQEDSDNDRSNSKYLTVPSEKHAKSMIAFAKLSMLMNDLGDECRVDWTDDRAKYSIFRYGNKIIKDVLYNTYYLLSFNTEFVRNAFFEKHQELIKEYFML